MAHGRVKHYAKEGDSADGTGTDVLTFSSSYFTSKSSKNTILLLQFLNFYAIIYIVFEGRDTVWI